MTIPFSVEGHVHFNDNICPFLVTQVCFVNWLSLHINICNFITTTRLWQHAKSLHSPIHHCQRWHMKNWQELFLWLFHYEWDNVVSSNIPGNIWQVSISHTHDIIPYYHYSCWSSLFYMTNNWIPILIYIIKLLFNMLDFHIHRQSIPIFIHMQGVTFQFCILLTSVVIMKYIF